MNVFGWQKRGKEQRRGKECNGFTTVKNMRQSKERHCVKQCISGLREEIPKYERLVDVYKTQNVSISELNNKKWRKHQF